MKALFVFIVVILIFYSCNSTDFTFDKDKNLSNTHFLKGAITHNITKENLSEIIIGIRDKNCPYSFGSICDQMYLVTSSDENGEFDFQFESYCDALINFSLNDTLKEVYGNSYRWIFGENNLNNIQIGGCYSYTQTLMTERNKDYLFDVKLQPQLFIGFKLVEIENLEFDSIAIPAFEIAQDSFTFLNRFQDINSFDGEFEVVTFYKSGTIKNQMVQYDFLSNNSVEVEIEI